MTYLDELTALQARVGYGMVGTGGELGYENKRVTVGGREFEHALSTHPPARLLYHLGGAASRFSARVALNDDVPDGASHADFAVVADGRPVAEAFGVVAGEAPREVAADVSGASLLELVVTTHRWDWSHAVWLEPELDDAPAVAGQGTIVDCLRRFEIELPPPVPPAERCIATAVSPGFEHMLDDLLGSVVANGACGDARIVVFILGTSPACEQVVAKYRAVPVRCRPLAALSVASKSVLYSLALVVGARRYLSLDADTLVLDGLEPVFAALDALSPASILACREGNGGFYRDIGHILEHAYVGSPDDIVRIAGADNGELRYPLVVNDGVFAGTRDALLALDGTIRAFPGAVSWLDERPDIAWRNQFVFNLALARLGSGVELDPTYNLQLHTSDVTVDEGGGRVRAEWGGRPVHVLHVNGSGRAKLPQLKGRFAAVADPVLSVGTGDAYGRFLTALRAWLGLRGTAALTWSMYGTKDADYARVRDATVFPLFALLHYLVRAQGCVRVLETGTARGVSAAVLASAVAHREGARVVTFDPYVYDGRHELWDALAPHLRAAIDERREDAIAGLAAALAAGERFDLALLDSKHTEEQLSAEFDLATQLVCPGGLILVHDHAWVPGLQAVLDRAQGVGYGVARLLDADGGVAEDEGLGLAIVENRVRS
jgi:predicted O-methyltransferase YrrM